MIRSLLVVFLIAAVSAAAAQQPGKSSTPEPVAVEKTPTVDHILDTYLQAIGGADQARRFSSRVMKGTFAAPAMGVTGTAEVYKAAPDKYFSLVHLEAVGDFTQGFDGQVAWSSDPNTGLRELNGEELADLRRQSQFYHELHFREIYPTRRVLGKSKVDGKDVWIVEATAPEAAPEKFYFEAASGLLVRHDSVQISQESGLR